MVELINPQKSIQTITDIIVEKLVLLKELSPDYAYLMDFTLKEKSNGYLLNTGILQLVEMGAYVPMEKDLTLKLEGKVNGYYIKYESNFALLGDLEKFLTLIDYFINQHNSNLLHEFRKIIYAIQRAALALARRKTGSSI